jgi:hypothetical protein
MAITPRTPILNSRYILIEYFSVKVDPLLSMKRHWITSPTVLPAMIVNKLHALFLYIIVTTGRIVLPIYNLVWVSVQQELATSFIRYKETTTFPRNTKPVFHKATFFHERHHSSIDGGAKV